VVKTVILAFAYILSFLTSTAQINKAGYIDTLKKKLDTTKSALNKVKILSRLSEYYQTADPNWAKIYENQGLSTAKLLKRDSDVCVFYGYIAETYIYAGDLKNGIRESNLEADLAKKNNYIILESVAISDIGLAYQMQGDYPQSQEYFFQSLVLAEQINNKVLMSICDINICSNYFNQNDFNKTIFYSEKVLRLCKGIKQNVNDVMCKAYELSGSSYLNLEKPAKAQEYYLAALKLYKDMNDSNGIATMYTLIVSTYAGNYKKQLEYGLKAKTIWDKMGPLNIYAISNLGNLGTTYGAMARQKKGNHPLQNKLYDKAENYLLKAIEVAKQGNSKQNIIFFTDSLAVIDAERGKFKDAYKNLVAHDSLYDSVYSQENKNKIASLEGKHDIELKVKEIQINKLEIANQQKQKWFLTGGLITILIFACLVYYQNVQRKNKNTTLLFLNNELDEANKLKTKFFSILNHDLRSPIASFVHFLNLQQNYPDLMDESASKAYSIKATAAAVNLLNIMEDLLLWSKGQMENFKPTNKTITVGKLFDYIITSLTPPDNVQLYFDYPPDMVLNVDEHYLKTIIHNLTCNSIKALAAATESYIIWKAWEEGTNKYLSITDNGPGATQEAFKPLYDDSAPIGIKNGLGLHIVRDLANAIKCQLLVTTKLGRGVELKLKFES
jgi:signal transduction histidine kinase